MSLESAQGRDLPVTLEPLPPAVTAWARDPVGDSTMSGAPLPPYRPGLHVVSEGWSAYAPSQPTAWGAQPPDEWLEATEPSAAADLSWQPDDGETGETEAGVATDEDALPWSPAVEEPIEDRDWPRAESQEPEAEFAATDQHADEPLVLEDAIPEDDAGRIDEPPFAWVEEVDDEGPRVSGLPAVPSGWAVGETAIEPEPPDLAAELVAEHEMAPLEVETGPDRSWWADDVEPAESESREQAAVEQPEAIAEPVSDDAGWASETDLAREEPYEEPPAAEAEWIEPTSEATAAGEWLDASAEGGVDFPWDAEPPLLDIEPTPASEPGAADLHDSSSAALYDEAGVAPETESLTAASDVPPAPGPALPDADADADERVGILEPTSLDDWLHGDRPDEAAATWEAFGRALEEAASWGDLGASIATGQPQEVGQPSAEAATGNVENVEPEPASDDVLIDLARRLEALARRLREEGDSAVDHVMAEGDRLDASLAGFIAGYRAARRD